MIDQRLVLGACTPPNCPAWTPPLNRPSRTPPPKPLPDPSLPPPPPPGPLANALWGGGLLVSKPEESPDACYCGRWGRRGAAAPPSAASAQTTHMQETLCTF